jgi:hypothetical protein
MRYILQSRDAGKLPVQFLTPDTECSSEGRALGREPEPAQARSMATAWEALRHAPIRLGMIFLHRAIDGVTESLARKGVPT